jgi:hypothetical protein
MSESSTPTQAEILPSGVLCAGCAYDLAGLRRDGLCPECGKPIIETLRGNWLSFADRSWLRKVRRGIYAIVYSFWAVLCSIILWFLALIALMGAQMLPANLANPVESFFDASLSVLSVLLFGVVVVAPFVALWGWFAATAREPGVLDPVVDKDRVKVRWSVLIWLGFTLLSFTGISITSMLGVVPGGWGWLVPWALYAAVSSFHYWTAMQYIRSLAVRIPDAKLSNTAMDYRLSLVLVNTLGMVLCCIGPLVAFIMYISVLDTLCRRFRQVMKQIDQHDQSTPNAPTTPTPPEPDPLN